MSIDSSTVFPTSGTQSDGWLVGPETDKLKAERAPPFFAPTPSICIGEHDWLGFLMWHWWEGGRMQPAFHLASSQQLPVCPSFSLRLAGCSSGIFYCQPDWPCTGGAFFCLTHSFLGMWLICFPPCSVLLVYVSPVSMLHTTVDHISLSLSL